MTEHHQQVLEPPTPSVLTPAPPARLVAFYLPQFHPIPENDAWWSPGFTEWTNVARARRRYPGHYQPRIPADLGFYDLRLPETRMAQAELATAHGIEGFCYYHYWFAGHRLLQRPFEEVLRSGEPRLPFCLCWANQTWSGIWHGAPSRVLIEQTYPGVEDYTRHFEALLPAFLDPRHIRVDGKPLFVIHDPEALPDGRRMTDLWRDLAHKAGLGGIFFVATVYNLYWKFDEHGFDARVFQALPRKGSWYPWNSPLQKARAVARRITGTPNIYQYQSAVRHLLPQGLMSKPSFPCVVPDWDNTARSGWRGRVLHGATPELFEEHLTDALRLVEPVSADRRLVFIKSFNEWAEGNYLEPDLKFGHRYLDAVSCALGRMSERLAHAGASSRSGGAAGVLK